MMMAAPGCVAACALALAVLAGQAGALAPASIVIDSFEVSPPERTGVPPGAAATFDLTITLANQGGQAGTARLAITGMDGAVALDNLTIEGGKAVTRTYPWTLKGDRRHSCMATITSDVGAPSNMPAAADLHYAAAAPGFDAPLLALAVLGVAALGAARHRVSVRAGRGGS
jgi:hypothetical protein